MSATSVGERGSFLSLMLEGDRHGTERYVSEVFERRGTCFLYDEVIKPALVEIGRLWSANRITVADEHLATATVQSAVAGLYSSFRWPVGGPRVIVACAQGDRHDFAARMVADVLALEGWDDRFLGADVSVDDLVRYAERIRPKVVAISVTLPIYLPMVKLAAERLRDAVPRVKLLVGGSAIDDLGGAADAVAADAIARSCSQAVQVVRAWK